MFCRFCYYDLHGQEMPRCPECGTAFAFDDPDSFLRKTPGSLGRTLFWLRRRRLILIIAMTVLLLWSYAAAHSHLPSLANATHPIHLARTNLKRVMTARLIQRYKHPQQTVFDLNSAKKYMQPSFSPWSEAGAAHTKALITDLLVRSPFFIVPTMAYLLAVSLLAGRRVRRGVLILLVALSLVLFGSSLPRKTADLLCGGTYEFLNDIVFLPGIDLASSNPQRGKTIAAYDAQSFCRTGGWGIAFADGHVQWYWDDRAKPLFQAQGVPYPEQGD